jgi:hypothetical protein
MRLTPCQVKLSACNEIFGMRQGSPRFVIGPDGRKQGVVLGVTYYHRLLRRIETSYHSIAPREVPRNSSETVRKRVRRAREL